MTNKENRSSAKDAIFTSIRKSLAESIEFDAEHQRHHRQMTESFSRPQQIEIGRETLISNFRSGLESVGGYFYSVSTMAEAASSMRRILDKVAGKRIAVSESALVEKVVSGISDLEFRRGLSASDLFSFDVGITSAQWAIGETGTLVLESDLERHRLTSLIPSVHICLLPADRIRQTLGEILELTRANLSSAMTFVTGASRTSDIELTLAIGVHGPAELHVIVVV